MFMTFLGVLLIFIPLLLSLTFKNKLLGLLYVSVSLIAFEFLLFFTTQLFHVFYYWLILTINIIVSMICILFIIRKGNFTRFSINWLAIIGFVIIAFNLGSVHYLYTGTVSTITGYQEVSYSYYPYPYFSDEWVGVSLTKYSIENASLSLVNPLRHDTKVVNPFITFFSFISGIFLLVGINPLTGFPVLSLLAGILICLLTYILLRVNKVSSFVSIISAILITYITNGANLPGIWYLLPYTGGLIMLLFGLIALSLQRNNIAILSFLMSSIFYAPITVFWAPILLIEYFRQKEKILNLRKIFAVFSAIILFTIFIIYLARDFSSIRELGDIIWGYLLRNNLDNGIPSYAIWNIIPAVVIPFSILGFIKIIRDKKYFIACPMVIGSAFWIVYAYVNKIFIIDYARIVQITSILFIVASGFGIEWLIQYLSGKSLWFQNKKITTAIKIAFTVIFCLISLSYTDQNLWDKLILNRRTPKGIVKVSPAAPANHYLTSDDLLLFEKIENKRFISTSWKGLVIGVATDNFPMDSKASIISNIILPYNTFMNSDCSQKSSLAKRYKISYVYSGKFKCDNFSEIGHSAENLYLYRYVK